MKVQGNSGATWRLSEPPVAVGPFALVYRGEGEDGFPVAVKVARHRGREGGWVEDEADELRAWGAHPVVGPRVVPVWDAGIWEGRAFHVTSWFAEPLAARCGQGAVARREELARALVRAVVEVRSHGLVHPNLHPRNVFVEDHEDGPAVFLGDPCERPALRPAWSTSAVLPSSAHAPPEHVLGLMGADDAFALAACVFAVLVGHPPEAALENALALTDEGRRFLAGAGPGGELGRMIRLDRCVALTAADRAALAPFASPRLVATLAGLLEPDPARRARDPAALLHALAPQPPPRRSARPAVAAALGVVLLAVAAAATRHAPEPAAGPPPDYAMVELPPGTFLAGSPADAPERGPDEEPHRVTLTRGFRLGVTEVTQAQYAAVLGANPTATGTRRWGGVVHGPCSPYDGQDLVGPDLPVACASWLDAVRLANAWSRAAGLAPAYTLDGDEVTWDRGADGYRLPTEAEWEYAARAGTTGPWGAAPDLAGVCAFANVRAGAACDDGVPGLLPVGRLAANGWGAHDLLGNIQEWTWDRYAPFTAEPLVDPTGPEEGELRVNRGGSWFRTPRTVAWRSADAPDVRAPSVGVRLARGAR